LTKKREVVRERYFTREIKYKFNINIEYLYLFVEGACVVLSSSSKNVCYYYYSRFFVTVPGRWSGKKVPFCV